jgi:hypothetical protein
MKPTIKICFVITPASMGAIKAGAPILYEEIIRASLNGASPVWNDALGGTEYKFTTTASDSFVSNEIIEALFQFGVEETKLQYWCEVPDSALDNLIDVDWPRAKKIVMIDEVETEVRVQLQDYTSVRPGVNGTSLVRCGAYEAGVQNFLSVGVDTAEWRGRYQAKFGNLVFHQTLIAWQATNVPVGP